MAGTKCNHERVSLLAFGEVRDWPLQCVTCYESWPLATVPLDVLQRITKHLVQFTATRTAEAN